MNTDAAARTRLVLVGAQSRLDIAAPAGQALATALAAVGVKVDSSRHALVDSSGRQIPWDAPAESVGDGALLTLVDTHANGGGRESSGGIEAAARADQAAPRWLVTVLSALLLVASLSELAAGSTVLNGPARIGVSALIALAAAATGSRWARRRAARRDPGALVAPLLLAFTAACLAMPGLFKGAHLAVTAGLLAAAVLAAFLAAATADRVMRAAALAAMTGLLTVAAVWGATLLLGWTVHAASALTMGLVAPGLRYLPSSLLRLPEGYSIEYRHFLGNRWSVRGAVPEDPGAVTMDVVRPFVDQSTARLAVGVAFLSGIAPLMTPWVSGGLRAESVFERSGTIALLATTVLALVLWPRRTSAPHLRWPPRIAAALTLVVVGVALVVTADALSRVAVAGGLLVVGLAAAAVLVPVSRHPAPLAWSRVGDVLATMSVVLAPPAAMLAAGTLDFVRAMVSG